MTRVAKRRKKVSWFRKLTSKPLASIAAAVIGGVFSLSSTILPKVLPLLQAREGQVPQAVEPRVTEALNRNSYGHELPTISAAPVTNVGSPITFNIETVSPSFARAEAQSPAVYESRSLVSRRPNLTYGVWTIFAAKDARGNLWNNSTLKITAQNETADGLQVAGFLDWRANGRCAGREYVVGNYDEHTRHLYLEGRSFSGCDRKLALSACSARLSPDGRRLTEGVWGSVSAHKRAIPGRWEAIR